MPNNRGHRERITRSMVLKQALEIIDSQGVGRLTMRELAASLQVYPSTIYWHAGNKEMLLALVCEQIFDDLELPPYPGELDWEGWLLYTGDALRQELHRHPNVAPLLASQLQVSPSSFRLVNAFLTVIESIGFPKSEVPKVYNTVVGFIFGWIFGELAPAPENAASGWEQDFKETLENVDPWSYPALHRHQEGLTDHAFMLRWNSGLTNPLDTSFTMAMKVLATGLRATCDSLATADLNPLDG